MILPGDAGAVRPTSNNVKQKIPLAPPAIVAKIRSGFIRIYGK